MKELIKKLEFVPKNNSNWVYFKKYSDNTIIEVDFEKKTFHFGWKIKIYDKEFQNITKDEDWVVLECVDRLLTKWYKSEDISLEKVYPTWRWTSWRLDILVMKDKKAFLMIECKTWWLEYEKELNKMKKDWWQLFTYFQQDRDAEFLTLYTSQYNWKDIDFKNDIVKIEEAYRETSNVEDLYARWNKFTKQNGIFENWVKAYNFESKALTRKDLIKIKQEDSSIIFNRFLEILRHNTVSDKPNAFNKIFTLFLCKIYDEWNKSPDDELEFQFKEWIDDDVTFQVRLTDLYKRWMMEFLKKDITDFNDEEFNKEFWWIDESIRIKILEKITRLRLQKNNEFAIKEVFDEETFKDNAKVLKEVVELLQVYQIRYAEKQPFLWDFFELLLTTWLKQESWQFFTPVPIARFICKSIPVDKIIENKLINWDTTDLLPSTIDYAAWSWHFLTEAMEEIQNVINSVDVDKLKPNVSREIKKWQNSTFDWAWEYMYWIEKDYRLVKTAKVGCYLHWDGIATVIHWDWLDSFWSKHYRWKLKIKDWQDNSKFDLILSNPPYSVSAFKWNLDREKATKDFNLYKDLSDKSSEIECLFIERTSQLLKEWWVAWIVLPSSILNNTWIYTKAREIILKNFDIISIASFGSNTFMATGTNTVVLFMRKRNKFFAKNLEDSINKLYLKITDISLNNIEWVVSKYSNHVWWVNFKDYETLCQKTPNEAIKKSELFKEYENKFKWQKIESICEKILEVEKEKILYFILSYSQNTILIKSWDKQIEKEFLGYEFSNRKWSEWIHPIQWWKLIDECTKLFDPEKLDNPQKVSTYIYDWFNDKFDRLIDNELNNHVFRTRLVDLITFDRLEFDKTISTSFKKKIRYEEIWWINKLISLWEITDIKKWTSITSDKLEKWNIPVIGWWQQATSFHNQSNREWNIITVSASWAYSWFVNYFEKPIFASDCNTIKSKDENKVKTKLIYEYLKQIQDTIYWLQRWQAQPHVYWDDLSTVKIPLPPLKIQEEIVDEINAIDKNENTYKNKIKELKDSSIELFESWLIKDVQTYRLSDNEIFSISIWKRLLKSEISTKWTIPVYSANVFEPFGYINEYLIKDFSVPSILWGIDGDWMVNYVEKDKPFYPTDHCWVLRIMNSKVNERFLAYVLNKEGARLEFSRTKRASIDSIQWIRIALPPIEIQNIIAQKVEAIEKEIKTLEQELSKIPDRKKEILSKYL